MEPKSKRHGSTANFMGLVLLVTIAGLLASLGRFCTCPDCDSALKMSTAYKNRLNVEWTKTNQATTPQTLSPICSRCKDTKKVSPWNKWLKGWKPSGLFAYGIPPMAI